MAITYNQHDLLQAIDKVEGDSLRSILKLICNRSTTFSDEAAKHFLLPTTASHDRKRAALSEAILDSRATNKSKSEQQVLNRSRFERCRTCNTEFDVSENCDDSCQTHTDDLEIDDGYFVDDDELEQGHYNCDWTKDWRFEEFPEGFVWQCCERNATEEACVVRRHLTEGEQSPLSSCTSSLSSCTRSDDEEQDDGDEGDDNEDNDDEDDDNEDDNEGDFGEEDVLPQSRCS